MLIKMKKISVLFFFFIFIFSFEYSHSDSLKNIQIDGISVGDSLKKFYSKSELKSTCTKSYAKSKKYYWYTCWSLSKDRYETLQFAISKGDRELIINSIQGVKSFENVNSCKKIQKLVISNFDNIFTNDKKVEERVEHPNYKGTGSYMDSIGYVLNDRSGVIEAACYHWKGYVKKQFGVESELRVVASKKDFYFWLVNEAYK